MATNYFRVSSIPYVPSGDKRSAEKPLTTTITFDDEVAASIDYARNRVHMVVQKYGGKARIRVWKRTERVDYPEIGETPSHAP